jgi:hypothetical protein
MTTLPALPAWFLAAPIWSSTVAPRIPDGFGAALQQGTLSYIASPAPVWALASVAGMAGPLILVLWRHYHRSGSAPLT